MKSDTARTISATVTVAMAATFVVALASGATIPALIVIAGIGAFAAFVGATQDT